MTTVIDLVDELGKVRLVPLLVPALKIADPILGSLPRGFLRSILARKDRRDNLVKTVEAASPVLPEMIRLLGHLAESKLATGLLSLSAVILTPIARLSAPVIARLVVPLSAPALGLAGRSGSVLPSLVRGLDRLVRIELFFERPFKRSKVIA
jgi:hypothetical protein